MSGFSNVNTGATLASQNEKPYFVYKQRQSHVAPAGFTSKPQLGALESTATEAPPAPAGFEFIGTEGGVHMYVPSVSGYTFDGWEIDRNSTMRYKRNESGGRRRRGKSRRRSMKKRQTRRRRV